MRRLRITVEEDDRRSVASREIVELEAVNFSKARRYRALRGVGSGGDCAEKRKRKRSHERESFCWILHCHQSVKIFLAKSAGNAICYAANYRISGGKRRAVCWFI